MVKRVQCPGSFEGSLKQFYEQHGAGVALERDALTRAHQAVVAALEDSPLLVIRNFGKYQQAGKRFTSSDGSLAFVVGDNEPVVWSWLRHAAEENVDLCRHFEQQEIPISMAPAKGELEEDWKAWGNGDKAKPSERMRGEHGGRWKLCHTFRAAPDHLGDSAEDIRARFVRNFHPLNHFWFASEFRWRSGSFEMKPTARLGEWPPLCLGMWDLVSDRYPEQARWFLAQAKVEIREVDESARRELTDFSFAWRPTQSAFESAPTARSDRGMAVVEVRENGQGRYHLQGFGKSQGGEDRKRPFEVVVYGLDGTERARSLPTTAEELGIAKNGMKDYLEDAYRRTDFIIFDDDQTLSPDCFGYALTWR